MGYIHIPEVGDLTKEEFLAYKAAKEYDERLVLKFNPPGNDYVIFIKTDMSDGMPPLKKVLGFGPLCPNPDEVRATLYNADGWKHGDKVLRDMDAREKVRESNARKFREALAEEAAERIEVVMRKDGNSPIIKSLPKS